MLQKIYPQDVHQLDIRTIDKDALYVLEKLTASGHVAYLVGGGVRDLLLKKKPKDFDISTSAEPEEIKKIFRNCILIGRRFRLAHIRFGKKVIEVSTFRSGDNENDALILRDNVWGSQEEDVLRRDFTINGLFYDAARQTVIDYVGGFPDLEKGHLRTIGQPFIRFKQDPVRMIRLLKFRARFGFEIDHDTRLALIESKHEILKSSSARILEELLRMLESGASEPFFRLMIEYGLLQLMLPAVAGFMEEEEGAQIYSFLQAVDEYTLTQDEPLDRALLLAVLVFPLLEKRLIVLYAGRDKPPHLGEIQKEVLHIVREAFGSFFLIPKRLKIIATTILFLQFRLNAPEKKRSRPPRIPQDPSLSLALKLLTLRSQINNSLAKAVEYWQELIKPLDSSSETSFPEFRKRRRRRKPRPSPLNPMTLKQVPLHAPLPLFYVGPDIVQGDQVPCLVYLALSAKESLQIDPFCQIATFLQSYPVRIVSLDLPFHGEGMMSNEGITKWAEALERDEDLLATFLDALETSLRLFFFHISPSRIAVAGLSRGGFLASHIAARMQEISSLLVFAPLTDPGRCLELIPVQESPLLKKLDLQFLTHSLASKNIRVYIGNRDQRVHTDSCYAWVRSLVEEAFSQKIKSPSIEFFLKPSIGYMGHGTSKESFEEGALWIVKQLCL